MNPTASPIPTDDPVLELQRANAQVQNQLAPLIQMNPFAGQSGGEPGAVPSSTPSDSFMPAELSVQMERIKQVMNNPAVKSYMQLLNTPEFTDGAKFIASHPQKMHVVYGEGVLFVLLIFVKAWRSSRTKHWAAQLWVSFSTYAIGVIVGSILLPGIIFGAPFWKMLHALGKVFLPSIF